jgi:hypothetical protein
LLITAIYRPFGLNDRQIEILAAILATGNSPPARDPSAGPSRHPS